MPYPPIATRPVVAGPAVQVRSLSIGTLELTGFRAEHRYRIADACQQEIGRLLNEQPLVAEALQSGNLPLTPSIVVNQQSDPVSIGYALARALVDSLRKSQGSAG